MIQGGSAEGVCWPIVRWGIDSSKPEWSTTEARKRILAGVKAEVAMLIKDIQALLPCQCNSRLRCQENVSLRQLVLVETCDEISQNQQCQGKADGFEEIKTLMCCLSSRILDERTDGIAHWQDGHHVDHWFADGRCPIGRCHKSISRVRYTST